MCVKLAVEAFWTVNVPPPPGLLGSIPLDEVSVGGQVKRVETYLMLQAFHR